MGRAQKASVWPYEHLCQERGFPGNCPGCDQDRNRYRKALQAIAYRVYGYRLQYAVEIADICREALAEPTDG